MKKLIYCVVALFTSTTLFAQAPTALTQIKLTSEKGAYLTTTVVEMSSYAPTFDETSIKLLPNTANTDNVNIFTLHGTDEYSEYRAQTLVNVPMGIITDRNDASKQHYTLLFTVAAGRELKLYDAVLDSTIVMKNNTSYVFEVNTTNCPSYVSGKNITISNRFIIEPKFVPSTDPLQVCHENGKLIINSNPYEKNIIVKNASGVKVIDKAPITIPQEIVVDTLPAGHYTVEFDGGAKEYVIFVNPTVTPETPVVP